jgi:hypothetical protein
MDGGLDRGGHDHEPDPALSQVLVEAADGWEWVGHGRGLELVPGLSACSEVRLGEKPGPGQVVDGRTKEQPAIVSEIDFLVPDSGHCSQQELGCRTQSAAEPVVLIETVLEGPDPRECGGVACHEPVEGAAGVRIPSSAGCDRGRGQGAGVSPVPESQEFHDRGQGDHQAEKDGEYGGKPRRDLGVPDLFASLQLAGCEFMGRGDDLWRGTGNGFRHGPWSWSARR